MIDAWDQGAQTFLRKTIAFYEGLVAHTLWLEERGDDEQTLRWLGLAAGVAWMAHAGRFSDGRLEAIALRAGQRLQRGSAQSSGRGDGEPRARLEKRRILHVATTIYETGGHTRLIENWVRHDASAHHSLIVLKQQAHTLRHKLSEAIVESGGQLMILPDGLSILESAARLRGTAQSGYDLLILHHHPDDVVPLVALATQDNPPVALMNHADHVFGLGVSVADAVIDFRNFGGQLSRERRSIRHSLTLPLPVAIKSPRVDRTEARGRLGIPPDEVMLLCIAAGYKFRPTPRHDFFRALRQVLDRNPTARLYVIGLVDDELHEFGATGHERMRLLGIISDPADYAASADLCLESFPYASYTGLLEIASGGVCPVLMHSPPAFTDLSGDIPLLSLVPSPKTETDYVEALTTLIRDPVRRAVIGDAAAANIVSFHGKEGWLAHLASVYAKLDELKHQPTAPPPRPPEEAEVDLDLARFISLGMRTPAAEHISDERLSRLDPGELLRLFLISLRSRDTRLAGSHVKAWLSVIKRKARMRFA